MMISEIIYEKGNDNTLLEVFGVQVNLIITLFFGSMEFGKRLCYK